MKDTMTTDDETTAAFDDYAAGAWPGLYRYAYLLAGNHADAEDLAQTTLMKAYTSWAKVRRADSPTAYLRRTLTNTFLSAKRPKARRLEVLSDAPPEPRAPADDGPVAVEDRLALWPHVQRLPERQRAVVVLRYYEGLSEREIADTLGCSPGTVKSQSHHAIATLRDALSASESEWRENR